MIGIDHKLSIVFVCVLSIILISFLSPGYISSGLYVLFVCTCTHKTYYLVLVLYTAGCLTSFNLWENAQITHRHSSRHGSQRPFSISYIQAHHLHMRRQATY